MLVFRICKSDHADDLSGAGSKLFGGRWNSKGHPVLYTSSTRALAALEVLVHIPATIPLSDYIVSTIELPESSMQEVTHDDIRKEYELKGLNAGFAQIGDTWLAGNTSLILKVPSIIIREEYNYLVNPAHPLFLKVKIKEKKPFVFDARLEK
jgi:RES domain-containing protein